MEWKHSLLIHFCCQGICSCRVPQSVTAYKTIGIAIWKLVPISWLLPLLLLLLMSMPLQKKLLHLHLLMLLRLLMLLLLLMLSLCPLSRLTSNIKIKLAKYLPKIHRTDRNPAEHKKDSNITFFRRIQNEKRANNVWYFGQTLYPLNHTADSFKKVYSMTILQRHNIFNF